MPLHQFERSLNTLGAVVSTTLDQQQLVSDHKASEMLEFHDQLAAHRNARRCAALGLDHLLCFDRVDQALASARVLQLAFPELKIGLHLGEVRYTAHDVFGESVEGAMLLSAGAECGEILVSSSVVNQLAPDSISATVVDQENGVFSIMPSLTYNNRKAS